LVVGDKNCGKDGNSLKKCDVPDSSYGKFEGTAGLNSGSLADLLEKRLSLILRSTQSKSSVETS
jgi:hypothetical protein